MAQASTARGAFTVSQILSAIGLADPVETDRDLPAGVGEAVSEDVRGRLRASQVNAVLRVRQPLMTVNVINTLALIHVLHLDEQVSPAALGWALCILLLALWQIYRSWGTRGRPTPDRTSRRTVRRLVRSAAVFGLVWSVPGLFLLPALDGFSLAFALAVITGMIAGGAYALYPIPAAALAFMAPVTLGGTVGLAVAHGALATGPMLIAAMFFLIFCVGVRRHGDLFVSDFLVRLELERRSRLVEDLLDDTRLELKGSRRLREGGATSPNAREVIQRLVAGIAHEFNNLLTVVRGHADLAGLSERTDHGALKAITTASENGAQRVQTLLRIAGKQRLTPARVALGDALSVLARSAAADLGASHRLTLDIDIDAGDAAIWIDRHALARAMTELIANARDAMPSGGTIRVGCHRMTSSKQGSDQCVITISDNGVGMPADVLQRASEPYFTTKPFGGGHGLGLAAVAGFVAQSGGRWRIESVNGEGTTVSLYFPCYGTPPQPQPERGGDALVVIDRPEAREAACRMLGALGFSVHETAHPNDALARLRSGPPVRFVLADMLRSDGSSGLDLARTIESLHPGTPLMFVSTWLTTSDTGGVLFPKVLRYPFTQAELAQHIDDSLLPAPASAD